jgi:hypothetical protein
MSGLTASSATSQSRGASASAGARAIGDTLTTADGLVFDVRIVARGLEAPTQLAEAPDGRLFVAERSGRVLILRTAGPAPAQSTVALDARALLDPPPIGPLGLALHPDFARNHFAYLAYVALGRRDQPRVRVVRLREVGDTLGEPAALFDEALAGAPSEGPQLAFGPDGLLYLAIAPGLARLPDASAGSPGGAILRIRDDGRPAGEDLVFSSGPKRPAGLAWHPDTGSLWAILAGEDGRARLRALGIGGSLAAPDAPSSDAPSPAPPIDAGYAFTPGGFVFRRDGPTDASPPAAWIALPDNQALWRVPLASPAEAEVLLPDALGRIGAIAQGAGGTVFVATHNRDGRGTAAAEDDLVLRLTPRARPPGS